MARQVTRLELKQQALQRANLERSKLIDPGELVYMINASLAHLYEILIATDENYFTKNIPFNTTAGTQDYPLPDDFYKEVGIDVNINGVIVNARRFMFSERNL